MNFFDAQDHARRATRWLVVVYIVSTILIVAGVTAVIAAVLFQSGMGMDAEVLAIVAGATALFIVGASLFKVAALSGGGGAVARQMGGTLVDADVQDPLRRRLRNVVEEMSIASGVPVPEIYVLEEEAGINAFAAGFSPADAAVAVTRGTLEILDRDELQGVIAHEFSHILNGDMRLNIRMMGVLFGIMVVGLIGRMILRGSSRSSSSFSRSNNNSGGLLIGLGLTLLGSIGVFFARLIKAAVSRQREYLADASAVQFTRQTDGIANALKKIGGYKRRSYFNAVDPEEVSHMLFAGGLRKISSMFATHPPLTDRIRALDPSFSESDYPAVEPDRAGASLRQSELAAEFAATAAPVTATGSAMSEKSVADTIGRPTPDHLSHAHQLHRSIPEVLYKAAHSPSGAYLLTIALILHPRHAEQQLTLVTQQLGDVRAAQVQEYFAALQSAGLRYWLPLLEIAFPALKKRPTASLEFLIELIRKLIQIDGEIDLREFCFYQIVSRHLQYAVAPRSRERGNRVSKKAARKAATRLLRVVADSGSQDPEARERAFRAGLSVFGDWADEATTEPSDRDVVADLESALSVLERINMAGRKSLVEAVTRTIGHDDRLEMREAELLRAICASLDCPLPPILSAV